MLVKDHNIDAAKAEQELKRNRFNNITTTYYLLLKRKERAGMFRQQYNEDVKKLLRRGKKGPSPTPMLDQTPPAAQPIPERNTPTPVQTGPSTSPQQTTQKSLRQNAVQDNQNQKKDNGHDSMLKKPTTAAAGK